MKALNRVFSYVWPQWPTLVGCILGAVLHGLLLAVSFTTVIPLLKVMMGEEGLHGWIDRTVCNWQYGMDFYVPDMTDFTGDEGTQMIYSLLVTDVKEKSPAFAAGLQKTDRIVGAGVFLTDENSSPVHSAKLLEVMATVGYEDTVTVQYRRINAQGQLEQYTTELSPLGKDKFLDRLRWKAVETAQWAVSVLPRNQNRANKARAVVYIILLMAGVTTVRCFTRFYQSYLGEKVVHVAVTGLRQDVFAHVMRMPVGFFSSKGTSDTTSRLIGDIAASGRGIKMVLGKTLREPMNAIFTLAFAFGINWQLTLIFLTSAPVVIFFFALLGKKIKKAAKRLLVSNAAMLGRIQGAMGALRVVKVYNRQEHETQLFEQVNQTLLRRMLKVSRIDSITNPLMEWLGMVAGSAALLVGAHWVSGGEMKASSFIGLLVLLGTSAEAIRKLSDVWNLAQQANAAAERVFEVVDEPVETEHENAVELPLLRDRIEFRGVCFTYPGADSPVLKDINLSVKAGSTVAVVGPNGSGKTTLVNLIPRFYEQDSGQIFIDGHDISQCTLKSLRAQIGMVTQNVVTFNDTVAANIGYGKADAARSEIIEAAKTCYCHEFIEPLEKGYDTLIGEHGSGFSGGQLQRIVIARAVVKNPSILIFDEAMSQVDADSEAKINAALSVLLKNRTCFIIAHRFSTVMNADTIVVMEQGRIIAQGKHQQLTKDCSLYRSLYETQLLGPG